MLSDIFYRRSALRIAVGIMVLLLVMVGGAGATKFIRNDSTGGDCTSIGEWNAATKTCALTTDLGETIQIDSDGITLNGNGYTITSSNIDIGNGVSLLSRTDVILMNLNIRQFFYGIYLDSSNNITLNDNNASNNYNGIYLDSSNNNTLSGNSVSNQLPMWHLFKGQQQHAAR